MEESLKNKKAIWLAISCSVVLSKADPVASTKDGSKFEYILILSALSVQNKKKRERENSNENRIFSLRLHRFEAVCVCV